MNKIKLPKQITTSTCIKWIELYKSYLEIVISLKSNNNPNIFAVLPRYYYAQQLELQFGYSQDYILRILRCMDKISSNHALTLHNFQNTDIERDRIIKLMQNDCTRD